MNGDHGKKMIPLAHRRMRWVGCAALSAQGVLILTLSARFWDKVRETKFNRIFSKNNLLKGNYVPTQGPGILILSLKKIFYQYSILTTLNKRFVYNIKPVYVFKM